MPTSTETTSASTPLERCLDPVEAADFFRSYWEQRPLFVPRREEGRFDDLLSVRDVEALVCAGSLRYPAFRLVKADEKLDVRDYTRAIPWRPVPFTGAPDVERVAAAFERGATIVLQALHHHWLPLARFCRALDAVFGHPVQANAYFTPRASQGLGVHHDTHDVFVLQVSGEKRWLVYEPALELPLRDQRYSEELGPPGDPVHDLTLAPGDTLYLPRGWLHEALTSETDSLHVTVGVTVYTWLDAVRGALEECAHELAFRRSVTDGGVVPPRLLETLQAQLTPERVRGRKRDRFLRTRTPIRDGQLGDLRALDDLDADTLLERRAAVIADVTAGDGTVALAYEGKHVVFPDRTRADIEFVANASGAFNASDLPGTLDSEGRLVLVRRLVREGFLRLRRDDASGVPW